MNGREKNRPAAFAISLAFFAIVLAGSVGCSRAGGPKDSGEAIISVPASEVALAEASRDEQPLANQPSADLIPRLEMLRKQGRFDEFVESTLNAASSDAPDPALQLLKAEALLSVGRHEDAEIAALGVIQLSADNPDPAFIGQALKLWTIARHREQKPLADPFLERLFLSGSHESQIAPLELLRFWSDGLGSRVAYRLSSASSMERSEVARASAIAGTISAELNAIQASVNGVLLPLVFIDSGAQHTLLTAEAAELAGVNVGPADVDLVGFASLKARPGIIGKLELGNIVLEDVPVLVGNSAPLIAAQGQMALGAELMHHVRFTLDYPRGKVFVAPASPPVATHEQHLSPKWKIPVWTFSQCLLAQGEMSRGTMARVLIDTGDRVGTFVSHRWAKRNLPQFQRPTSNLVFKFKPRHLLVDGLQLGNRSLDQWPVLDTIPNELERLDLVDVLLGHDLLAPYELTIDLKNRVLELRGDVPTPTAPAHPTAAQGASATTKPNEG